MNMELIEMKPLKFRKGFLRTRFEGIYKYSSLDREYYIKFYNDEVDEINDMDDDTFNLYFELKKKYSGYAECTSPTKQQREDLELNWRIK